MEHATPGLFVRKEITVEASQARAFDVFTRELGVWWPLATHHIGGDAAETAIIEPRAGGRWFERSDDGRECEWGRVLVWDPPGRLVLSWEISADFRHDESIDTEVEVSFVSLGPALTRVELEHRQLDSYGAAVDKMRGIFDSENGWTWILRSFASRARDAGKA
jgi:activator of Hsp90 ATPase-like protein